MEGWEIRRREARFRGVPLVVLSSSRTGGRRLDVHEFAGRDLPFAEDLGRAARSFTVRGVFLGDDHDLEADRLRDAFEREGPGELVLPHSAPISVAVSSFRIEEASGEARVQRFEAEFVEAGAPATPSIRPDTGGQVKTRVDKAFAALSERFAATWNLVGQTGRIIQNGRELAELGAEAVAATLDEIQALSELSEYLEAPTREIDTLETTIAAQITNGAQGAAAFSSAIRTLADLPAAPAGVFHALANVSKFGADLVRPGNETVARRINRSNHDELVGMVRRMGLAGRALVSSRITFSSSTEAAEVRDELAAALEVEISTASANRDDVGASELRLLRSATIRDIDARSAKLPARVTFTPPRVMSSLEISQRLYGTPNRAEEIVARNKPETRRPSRISAAAELEVISA